MSNAAETTSSPSKKETQLLARLMCGESYGNWKKRRALFSILALLSFSLYRFAGSTMALVIGIVIALICLYLQMEIAAAHHRARVALENSRGKNGEQEAVSTENKYQLSLVESLEIGFGDRAYSLSLKHRSEHWEEDDVCLVNDGTRDIEFHPLTFLSYLEISRNEYLENQTPDFIKSIRATAWLKLHYMDDARSYTEIRIGDEVNSIPAHYSTIDSYLGTVDDDIYVISSGFVDCEQNQLSELITKIDKDLWSGDSGA